MTRINVVPVEELCNQHLFAEWRELPRMNSYAMKASNGPIPKEYTLGTGHMRFFLDKKDWLEDRHSKLTTELLKRGYALGNLSKFIMSDRWGNKSFIPDQKALTINRERISVRLPKNAKWGLI
jgi:deoxyribonuclease (pyrimidine dimer)